MILWSSWVRAQRANSLPPPTLPLPEMLALAFCDTVAIASRQRRVQSVALRVLDERERLIQEFNPEEFWEVSMDIQKDDLIIPFSLNRKKSDPLLKEEEARNIENSIRNSDLLINEIVKKPVKAKPRAPFITSTLQQAASTKLSFGVKRTMRVAQKLYEAGHILI